MQHNWFITGFILLLWAILLLITVLLNLRTAMLLMPIVLIILLLYLSACLLPRRLVGVVGNDKPIAHPT